ncbi:MAG: methyl-accepting chemotaxis protein [Pseudolabrys sp.]
MSDVSLDLVSLRRIALRLLLGTIWLQPALIGAACLAYGASFLAPVATAIGIALAAQAVAHWGGEGSGRIVAGVSLMALISILVGVFSGQAVQVDLHMYYFAALALLVATCDWKVIAAATVTVAVHHIVLNFALPSLIYPGGSNLFRLALHAVILVLEAGVLIWLAATLENMFAAIMTATARAEASLRRAEASQKEALEAAARAEEAHRLYEESEQQSAVVRDEAEREQSRVLVDIAATVKHNAENAARADEFAAATAAVAERGGKVATQAVEAMSRIEEASGKISEIIAVIDEIARQTNLLALNAAVEAARAGEAGRGFAVVATEVRDLAQRSSKAAMDIKELITNSSNQIQEGVGLVNSAGSSLVEIVDSIKKVTKIVSDIAAASGEQARGLDRINARSSDETGAQAARTRSLAA